jgi:hypothetical protein
MGMQDRTADRCRAWQDVVDEQDGVLHRQQALRAA